VMQKVKKKIISNPFLHTPFQEAILHESNWLGTIENVHVKRENYWEI
jgi:hypothetical protein